LFPVPRLWCGPLLPWHGRIRVFSGVVCASNFGHPGHFHSWFIVAHRFCTRLIGSAGSAPLTTSVVFELFPLACYSPQRSCTINPPFFFCFFPSLSLPWFVVSVDLVITHFLDCPSVLCEHSPTLSLSYACMETLPLPYGGPFFDSSDCK